MENQTEKENRGNLPADMKITIDHESSMIAFMPGELDEGVMWLDKWQAKRLAKLLREKARAAGKP